MSSHSDVAIQTALNPYYRENCFSARTGIRKGSYIIPVKTNSGMPGPQAYPVDIVRCTDLGRVDGLAGCTSEWREQPEEATAYHVVISGAPDVSLTGSEAGPTPFNINGAWALGRMSDCAFNTNGTYLPVNEYNKISPTRTPISNISLIFGDNTPGPGGVVAALTLSLSMSTIGSSMLHNGEWLPWRFVGIQDKQLVWNASFDGNQYGGVSTTYYWEAFEYTLNDVDWLPLKSLMRIHIVDRLIYV